jgi:glycosyltransferase involved in cell wall biosynthesis
MKVAAIVCTHQRAARLDAALDALEACLAEAAASAEVELVVVANACTDGTADAVRRRWQAAPAGFARRVVEEPALGLARARLRGYEETRADVLVYCDDDVLPQPGSIERIAATAVAEPDVGGGGGRIDASLEPGACWPAWMDEGFRSVLAVRLRDGVFYTPPNEELYYYPIGAFVWWRRPAMRAWAEAMRRRPSPLGRRGRRLHSAEDYDIDFHILDAGYRLKYDSAIRAEHRLPAERLTAGYCAELAYWASRSLQRLRYQRNPKAWRHACGHLRDRYWRRPGELLERMRPLALSGDPEAIRRSLKTARQRGQDDEIAAKFCMPWRR